MTPAEIKAIRHKLGLSQAGLAAALNLGKDGGRTVRRYESGEREPIGPVVRLMTLYRDHPELLTYSN
jgi:DNA-binding transcriptional regulator YiaG